MLLWRWLLVFFVLFGTVICPEQNPLAFKMCHIREYRVFGSVEGHPIHRTGRTTVKRFQDKEILLSHPLVVKVPKEM